MQNSEWDEWMDGRKSIKRNKRMDGRASNRMDGWMEEHRIEWMDGWKNIEQNEWMDGRTSNRMNGWKEEH